MIILSHTFHCIYSLSEGANIIINISFVILLIMLNYAAQNYFGIK